MSDIDESRRIHRRTGRTFYAVTAVSPGERDVTPTDVSGQPA